MNATEVATEQYGSTHDAVPILPALTERLRAAIILGALMVAMMLALGRARAEDTADARPVRYLAACSEYQGGCTAIFASDFAPHWAGDFVRWSHYATFWKQMVHWLAKRT